MQISSCVWGRAMAKLSLKIGGFLNEKVQIFTSFFIVILTMQLKIEIKYNMTYTNNSCI